MKQAAQKQITAIISGKKTTAKEFYFDGCHKFYLIEEESDKIGREPKGWTSKDIYPIEQLKQLFENACPLKFINNVKLTKTFIKQCQKQTTIKILKGVKN